MVSLPVEEDTCTSLPLVWSSSGLRPQIRQGEKDDQLIDSKQGPRIEDAMGRTHLENRGPVKNGQDNNMYFTL